MKQRRKNPYEKGIAIHSAPSFARDLSRGRPRSVNRGIGGVGYPTPKTVNPDADAFVMRGRQHGQEREREFLSQSGVVEDPRHA